MAWRTVGIKGGSKLPFQSSHHPWEVGLLDHRYEPTVPNWKLQAVSVSSLCVMYLVSVCACLCVWWHYLLFLSLPHICKIVTTVTFATAGWVTKENTWHIRFFSAHTVLICLVCLCLGDVVIKIQPFTHADLYFRMLSQVHRLCSVLHVAPMLCLLLYSYPRNL